jgi:hypothetical protein
MLPQRLLLRLAAGWCPFGDDSTTPGQDAEEQTLTCRVPVGASAATRMFRIRFRFVAPARHCVYRISAGGVATCKVVNVVALALLQ